MKKPIILLATIFSLTLISCSNKPSSTCVVTFNSNGGSEVPSVEVNKGEKVSKPTNPSKLGYTFDNWTYQGNEWDFDNDLVNSNITLDANWDVIEYNITYVIDDGINNPNNPSTYTVEDEITLLDPTRYGYNFIEWQCNGTKITKIEKGSTGDIELEAIFEIATYTVNVVYDTTKGSVSGNGNYNYGSYVTLIAVPEENCLLFGWYADSEYKIYLGDKLTYSFTLDSGDETIYAWFMTNEEYESKSKDWFLSHGVIPTINTENHTITYGLYPQTVVTDSETIDTLDTLLPVGPNGTYFYDNEYFTKIEAQPFNSKCEFHNNEKIEIGKEYWFKFEPIVWNIIADDQAGTYTLFSSIALDASVYQNNESEYSSCYDLSVVRSYINTTFYSLAFMLNDEYVQVTHVKNDGSTTDAPTYYWSVDTDDKVFLLSYQDLLNVDYGFENVLGPSNTRVCKTTDFAKARGSYYKRYAGNPFDGNVIYWTRSPVSDMPGYAWIVNTDGAIGRAAEHQHVNYRYASVRPAITLKYNFD